MEEERNLSVGLSVACPTAMGDCYNRVDDGEKEDLSVSSSSLPLPPSDAFDRVNGPSASLAIFYPQLAGYELPVHPLLTGMSNHHSRYQNIGDIEENDDSNAMENNQMLFGSSMMNEPMRQKYMGKQKSSKRRPMDMPLQMEPNGDPNDYAMKNRKVFFCKLCEKTFKFQTSLLRHNNKVHISKYQCPTCHRVFSRQAYLDVHTSKQGSSCFLGNYSNIKSRSKSNQPTK